MDNREDYHICPLHRSCAQEYCKSRHLAVFFLRWRQITTDSLVLQHIIHKHKSFLRWEIRRLLCKQHKCPNKMCQLFKFMFKVNHQRRLSLQHTDTDHTLITSHVAQSCYSVIGDKPFLWSKPKFDPP